MSKRYLAVIELDVWADGDLEAARLAWAAVLESRMAPVVHVLPIDDALEHFQAIDLEDSTAHLESPICVIRASAP